MKRPLFVALLLVMFSTAVFAAPAFWYQWRSKLNGEEYCAQTSPGSGWTKGDTPYKNGRCEKSDKPGEKDKDEYKLIFPAAQR